MKHQFLVSATLLCVGIVLGAAYSSELQLVVQKPRVTISTPMFKECEQAVRNYIASGAIGDAAVIAIHEFDLSSDPYPQLIGYITASSSQYPEKHLTEHIQTSVNQCEPNSSTHISLNLDERFIRDSLRRAAALAKDGAPIHAEISSDGITYWSVEPIEESTTP